jgi:hypothetical protein
MGMIQDFFRSMSEQRSYPYYYRLRADQRAKRRTVTVAAVMALVLLISFPIVTSFMSSESESGPDAEGQTAPATAPAASEETITSTIPDEAPAPSLPKLLDCLSCPEITLIESSAPGEMQRLGITRAPVTYLQYMEFVQATGHRPPSCIPQGGDSSVTCVSWDDTAAYIDWLILKTSKIYRLPNEAEWKKASVALDTEDQDLATQWLDGCGDAQPLQDADTPCQLRLIENGAETPVAETAETRNASLGFRLVRKLSRVSIY